MDGSIEDFWNEFYQHAEIASKGRSLTTTTIFRGVSNKAHELIPSIGRNTKEGTGGDITALEFQLIDEFKRLCLPELKTIPQLEMEWFFIAQHYGLPTRLLDWSSNPMVALFFAVYGNNDADGVLYVTTQQIIDHYELFDYRTSDLSEKNKTKSRFASPSNYGKVIFIRPRYTDQRYINQKSVFSCPSDPFAPLEIENCKKIFIKKEHKESIRKTLKTMGISHSYIYPGLAGIADEVKLLEFVPLTEGKIKIKTIKEESTPLARLNILNTIMEGLKQDPSVRYVIIEDK
jgi:hypothetical protein